MHVMSLPVLEAAAACALFAALLNTHARSMLSPDALAIMDSWAASLKAHQGLLFGSAATLLSAHLLGGLCSRKRTGATALVQDPTLDYRSKQDADPTKRGWGYTGVRFEISPEDKWVVVMQGGNHYPGVSGMRIPHFVQFILDMTDTGPEAIDLSVQQRDRFESSPPSLPEAGKAALQKEFGDAFAEAEVLRTVHSRGGFFAYPLLTNTRLVDAVVSPSSVEQVVALIALAKQHQFCLIPRGGGTNVSNMLEVPPRNIEPRPVISVDMKRMNKVLSIDEANGTAEIEAGIMGRKLEQDLNARGYTMGHEPDSYEFSTLGGWISTAASGMKRTRYGNIEDMIQNATVVTASGDLHTRLLPVPRASHGPELQQLLYGSEGNLGLIVSATAKVHRLPEVQTFGAYIFPNYRVGVHFLRELYSSGMTPAACRLVDNDQFRFGHALKPEKGALGRLSSALQKFVVNTVLGFDPHVMVAMTCKYEGTAAQVAAQEAAVAEIAGHHGGFSGGAENGRAGYNVTMAIAYIADFVAEHGVIGETFETCAPWDRIHDVIDAAKAEAFKQHKAHGLPGKPFISSRITQQYHSGVCIYFTFGSATARSLRPRGRVVRRR
jgi:alkyldihydroxyacetonephosphate synthase